MASVEALPVSSTSAPLSSEVSCSDLVSGVASEEVPASDLLPGPSLLVASAVEGPSSGDALAQIDVQSNPPLNTVEGLSSGDAAGLIVPQYAAPLNTVVGPSSSDISTVAPGEVSGSPPVVTASETPFRDVASAQIVPSTTRTYSAVAREQFLLEEIGTPTQHISGAPFVLIPDENIEAAKQEFKEFIFAQFHGPPPDMGRVIGVVNAIWARNGPRIFVHKIGPGAFLLKVHNQGTRDFILNRNMWYIAGHPMFVAPWSPEFNPEKPPITSAAVTVEFRGIPYLLFNSESLGRIATAVGKPVALAPETARKENFEVAKIIVRIDLLKELPSRVVSGYSDGREFEVDVSYPWLPSKCVECNVFGHATSECRRKIPPASGLKGKSRSSSRRSRSSRRARQAMKDASQRQGRSRPPSDSPKSTTTSPSPNAGERPADSIPAVQEGLGTVDHAVARGVEGVVVVDVVGDVEKETLQAKPGVVDVPIDSVAVSDPGTGNVSLAEDEHGDCEQHKSQISTSSNATVEGEQAFFLVSHRKSGRKATK